ncbi:SAM-dependent methyltransferase [Mycobacterium talmoniae]|uniref:SAM-dependent methyltransferase n=1 Tax=Mycobacterium talmoniae TaxID=1858794 RepID=A0A1S1NLK0_9MYCO|nr:SAM-dependent methyltransferase [Mycobacterium talmoniae]TDH53156.1 SAM-dependent methyltransferase [Mycobacterium eburneum]
MRDYVYDQNFAEERTRLASSEQLWDPGSQQVLEDLGVGAGWNCLEVGAGVGSLVEWMAGRGASVLAVDIDTRFIEPLASDRVEIRRVDIRSDDLPASQFDLVHARLVLEHLAERRQIVRRLVDTLRPGGWLMIEDYDWSSFGFDGTNPQLDRAAEAIIAFMQQAGYDPGYGRRVFDDLTAAGLTDIRGDGRARIIDSHSPGFDFYRLTFESIRDAVVQAGLLAADDADAASAGLRTDVRLFTPMMVAAIGRRESR